MIRTHRGQVRRVPLLLLVVALGVVVLGGCGGDEDESGPPDDCTRIEGDAYTLVAQNLAWNTVCLRVDQGTEVTFTVDNRDQGVQHNLDISGPSGEAKTELETGPVTQTLDYDASEPGEHEFVCDIHSNMEGELWVDPAPPG